MGRRHLPTRAGSEMVVSNINITADVEFWRNEQSVGEKIIKKDSASRYYFPNFNRPPSPDSISVPIVTKLKTSESFSSLTTPSRQSLGLLLASTDERSIEELKRHIESNTLLDLTDLIEKGSHVGMGSFGDVYKGKWKGHRVPDERRYDELAIKVLRMSGDLNVKRSEKMMKSIHRELTLWRTLSHENLVPFIGIMNDSVPSLVSEWMPNGTLVSFLSKRPDASRDDLAIGVAKGLKYLHDFTPSVIHGDLKASNVLIDALGNPRLSDFGLSWLIEETNIWNTSATHALGSIRWSAPELLKGMQRTATKACDIYAYAMTCYEIYTGRVPFYEYNYDGLESCGL